MEISSLGGGDIQNNVGKEWTQIKEKCLGRTKNNKKLCKKMKSQWLNRQISKSPDIKEKAWREKQMLRTTV